MKPKFNQEGPCTGQKIGNFTVRERSHRVRLNSTPYWSYICQCECGTTIRSVPYVLQIRNSVTPGVKCRRCSYEDLDRAKGKETPANGDGARLRAARHEKKLTQKQTAKLLGMSNKYLSRLELSICITPKTQRRIITKIRQLAV